MLKTVLLAAVTAIVIILILIIERELNCKVPRKNEIYSSCVNGGCYGARKCSEKGLHKICVLLKEGDCKEGYICEDGYLRNDKDSCIPVEQCLERKCSGPNEFYSCGGACDNICETLAVRNQTNCDIINIKCNDMCYCEEGYARNKDGICVPFAQCPKKEPASPKPPRCGELEVPDSCANGGCYKERKCSDIIRPTICVDPIECIPGCLCKEGYLRNKDGKCIEKSQCPEKLKCPRQNEVFDPCVDKCYQISCENIDKQYNCPFESANQTCTGGCICEPGYYKNKIHDCISEENCRKCSGPNEFYSCGGACDNICETLAVRNQTNCDIINIKCNEMCYCIKGYARNKDGICVPFAQCPEKAKCGKNEELIKCPALYCKPRTCAQKGTKPFCPRISPGLPCPGSPGCVCKTGYLRGPNGDCIPEAQCPPTCGTNEIYSNCTNGGCFGAKTCEEIDKVDIKCVKLNPKDCIKGCMCNDGYVKDKNGACVTEAQCPKIPPKCGKFEIADDCANGGCYSERNCTDIGSSYKCVRPKICKQGCLCKSGYLRDRSGNCILRKKCPNYSESDEKDSKEENSSEEKNKSNEDSENDQDDDEHESNDGSNETNCNNYKGNSTDDQNKFSRGIATFSSRFIKETANSKKNDNVVMSPYSVLIPLAELALYTIGKSLNQLLNAIGLQTKCQIRSVFKDSLEEARDQENITFNLAAIVYVNDKYELTDAFLKDTAEVFGAAAKTINVGEPQTAANTINKWVEDQTNNNIKNLVTSDMITQDTRLFLINAVYFKGKWKYPFDPKRTTKRDFYVTANNVQKVDTMFLDTRVDYAQSQDLDAKILRLPYGNDKFTAVIILPNKIDGVDGLLDKMQDINKYNAALESLRLVKVKIWLPKFKISTTIDLSEILQKLGVTDMFTSQSGLTGILKSEEKIGVTSARQKCFIDVSEEGTEATAANAIGVSVTSVQLDPPEFKADHPFVFALYYKGDVMFSAVHRKPSTE